MHILTDSNPSYLTRLGRWTLGLTVGTLLAQTAWADSVTLSPTADTRIFNADWGWNNNDGAGSIMGTYQGRDRSLIQFDFSSIPAGQMIVSATLTVYAHTEWGANPTGDPIEVYRLVTPWTEMGVTWMTTDSTTAWGTSGGDAVGTTQAPLTSPYSISTQNPAQGQPITWDISTLVRDWYAGTFPNQGLLLVLGGTRSAGLHFYTKEQADPALRPTLTIQYSASAVAPTITAQPQSRSAVIGDTVIFTAAASGTPPMNYQWYKDGTTLLTDQTNNVLTLTNLQLSDAGAYALTASNEAGTATSDAAQIEVFVANVAKGAAASQSTTASGGVASRAVDGNTSGNWGNGSVTHTGSADNEWWEVNLGTPTFVDRVQLWFRTDCCQDRNENLRIVIYDTADPATRQILWSQDVGPSPGETKGFAVSPPVEGQVVRVEHPPGTALVLSLAEVQVFTGDHVLVGPVAQSVTMQGGRSLALVVQFDQFLDPLTASDLSNYALASGGPPTAATLLPDGKSVALSGVSLGIGDPYSVDISGIKSVAGHLMPAPQSFSGTVGFFALNWALSGTASQSSTGYGGEARRAIDGNNDGNWGSGTITHSAEPTTEVDRYWEVDLGALQQIGRVTFWFRTDCCQDRNTNFTVRLLDDSRVEVVSYQYPGAPGRTASFALPTPLPARFVRFEPGTLPQTPFSLSEVEVVAPYIGASIVVTQSPISRIVAENSSPVLGPVGAIVSNAPASELQVQWQRSDGLGGFTNIPGANAFAYTNPPIALDESGAEFRALLYISGISAYSDVAVVQVVNDTVPPTLENVTLGLGPGGEYLMTLHFSELMDQFTLLDRVNYLGLNGVNVDAVFAGADGKSAALTLSGLADQLGFYMLGIGYLYDLVGNPMNATVLQGQFPVMERGSVNIALGGTASQSSEGFGGVPGRAIDGNTSGLYGENSMSHTAEPPQLNEYWEVDLGSVQLIGGVHLWFRTECCQDRNEKLRIVLYDTADPASRSVVHLQDVGPMPGSDRYLDVIPPAYGRVVRVEHLPGIAQFISLAEVQVYSSTLFPSLQLSVTQSTGTVTLSWPVTVTGFALETTSQLDPVHWEPVPGVIDNSVTLPIGPTNGYFRLKSLY